MAFTFPRFFSMLSQPMQINNFLALQSTGFSVGTSSGSVTFLNIPSTNRVTLKISNRGSNGVYVASGVNTVTAIVSTSNPNPTSGPAVVSNCDFFASGAIYTQDYIAGTNTFAFICSGTSNVSGTFLELSIGSGS